MKKNLLLVLVVLFVLTTSAFAGISDPKKDSEKPAVTTRENKLSDEELSRMSRRAETDNLYNTYLMNKENSGSKDKLKASNQVIVESRHHYHHGYVIYGGGSLLLIVLLIVILA